MTYIIKSHSHQYLVSIGDYIEVEKLELNEGDTVDVPILVSFGEGKALLNPGNLKARLVSQVKGDKIRVVKYKAKSNYHKQSGHRQKYSLIQILEK